ncbi:MAG TPA: hypothetical protein VEZ52_04395 [Desulfovibrio sp.]|uniref:hypothetical protein n=1 Tax=Desulfovibrio sp. TaxID=885 RepID=UPI002D2674F6|nr:hypothetical protein [Desulfovibrio sp.]HZF60846.1 hypothetical protein [Desulfovibrio sp.]
MTPAPMAASLDALPVCSAFFPQAALARRVPWPDAYAHAPLNPDVQTLRSAIQTPLTCTRMAFVLFYLPEVQAEALLRLALESAEIVLVADFKLAERNLELPATLAARSLMAIAGTHKLESRRDKGIRAPQTNFIQRGGIEGLVHQCNALVHERRPIFAGAAALLHLQRA